MSWLLGILNKLASSKGSSALADEHHRTLVVDQLVQAMHQSETGQEKVWTQTLFYAMKEVVRADAGLSWLQHIQVNRTHFVDVDRRLSSVVHAIAVDHQQLRVFNIRAEWTTFVCRVLAEHYVDIDDWHDRERWLQTVLAQMSDPNERGLIAGAPGSALLEYVQWLARQHEWARDQALLHRVLYVRDLDGLDALFYGPANRTLTFVTAMAGIVLRMQYRAPTVACTRLHQQILAAWPQELDYIKTMMLLQSQMEGSSLDLSATIAKASQLSTTGYCAYFVFFGQHLHETLTASLSDDGALSLPPLD